MQNYGDALNYANISANSQGVAEEKFGYYLDSLEAKTNSLKASRVDSAAGLLKQEMRILGSICLEAADISQVPAGGALAVDRNLFSEYITKKIKTCKNINVIF